MNFPILQNNDRPYIPERGGCCPICGTSFGEQGMVYLSAGAAYEIAADEDRAGPMLEAFFHIGYHGTAVDCSDSADICIVEDLKGGQFDINFCSIQCLEKFFLNIVNALQKKLYQINKNPS